MRVFIPVSEKDSEELVRNDSATIGEIVRRLIGNPRSELLQKWNWKSASLSSLSRALIFFGANLGAGTRAAVAAMILEFAYRAITSGFHGAITQSFRKAQPIWAATLTVMLCVPAVTHSIEFAVHSIGGTQRIAASMGASVGFSVLSTAFNLFAMRRGILIVGVGRESILHDLRRLPATIAEFVSLPVLVAIRRSTFIRARRTHESTGGDSRREQPAA